MEIFSKNSKLPFLITIFSVFIISSFAKVKTPMPKMALSKRTLLLPAKQPIEALPLLQQISPQTKLLISLRTMKIPIFSTKGKNKLKEYENFLFSFNEKTDVKTIKQGFEQFFNDVVELVLSQSTIKTNDLANIITTLNTLMSRLAGINDRLSRLAGTQLKRAEIAKHFRMLKNKRAELQKKLDLQAVIIRQINKARSLSSSYFQRKINEYIKILQQINKNVLDEVKLVFINDLKSLISVARSKGSKELKAAQELILQAEKSVSFSIQQKQQIAAIAHGVSITMPKTLATKLAATVISTNVAFQQRLKTISAQVSLIGKILECKKLLPFITATTSPVDKNGFVTILSNLFLNQGLMKKQELVQLHNLFIMSLNHKYLLASNQKQYMLQWIQTLALGQELIDSQNQLVTSLKIKISQKTTPSLVAIKSSFLALNLLDTNLLPQEIKTHQKNSLIAILTEKFLTFYNDRFNRSFEEVALLKNLFDAARVKKQLVTSIGKHWPSTLEVTIAIRSVQAQSTVYKKLVEIKNLIPKLQPSIDRYEKTVLVNILTTIFSNRSVRAITELEIFNEILNTFTSSSFRKKKIFSKEEITTFNRWKKILTETLILLSVKQARTVRHKIALLQHALSSIFDSTTSEEVKIFINTTSEIFKTRGDFKQVDLDAIKKLLNLMQKKPKFLVLNQQKTLLVWIQEINNAKLITTEEKTYLEALITEASTTRNIDLFLKALGLFTPSSNKDIFINSLNILFVARKTLDKKKLKTLFNLVDKKKINNVSFLKDAQKIVLQKWLGVLKLEDSLLVAV